MGALARALGEREYSVITFLDIVMETLYGLSHISYLINDERSASKIRGRAFPSIEEKHGNPTNDYFFFVAASSAEDSRPCF